MRDLVAHARPDLIEAAVERLGCDPFDALDRGTAYQQPAIFCASLAGLASLAGQEPDCYAGHSLGEITSLVAAGSLSERDGLRLVTVRARLMQRVDDASQGAVLAVGTSAAVARELAAVHRVTLAVDNAPRQAVLSGDASAIAQAQRDARARGLSAVPLPIRAAVHTPAMASAADELRALLDEIDIQPPRRPCFSCVTATEFDDIRARLVQSLTCTVRWREIVLALHARGVRRFVDVGPGRVLARLVDATLADAETRSAHQPLMADA
jgi:[acyl-carrier-protein] S-malonyltransferase